MGVPSYASAHYTAGYDADLAAKALEGYAGATVGLLGTRGHLLRAGRRVEARRVEQRQRGRRLRPRRPHQGGQERRRAGLCPPHRTGPGRRDGGGLRSDPSWNDASSRSPRSPSARATTPAASRAFSSRSRPRPARRADRQPPPPGPGAAGGDQFSLLVENNGPGGYLLRARANGGAGQGDGRDARAAGLRAGGAGVLHTTATAWRSTGGDLGFLQRVHEGARPGRGEARPFPRPGLRHGGAPAHSLRRDRCQSPPTCTSHSIPPTRRRGPTRGPATTSSSPKTARWSGCTACPRKLFELG